MPRVVRPVYGYNPPGNPASSWLAEEIQFRRALLSQARAELGDELDDMELHGLGKVVTMPPLRVTGRLGPQRKGEIETKGGGWGELAALGLGLWALVGS